MTVDVFEQAEGEAGLGMFPGYEIFSHRRGQVTEVRQ